MIKLLANWFELPLPTRNRVMWFFALSVVAGVIICLLPAEYVDAGPDISDKLMHASAFFAYALLLDAASLRSFWRFQVPLLLGLGAAIEVLQGLSGWRTFSLLDFAADASGIMLYWLLFRAGLRPWVLGRTVQV